MTYVSDRVTEVFGETPQTFLGRRTSEIAKVQMDPAERLRYRVAVEALQPFRDIQYRLTLPNGRSRTIAASGKPVFAADGSWSGYRGTGRDITAVIEAEERASRAQAQLAHAIDGMPLSVSLFDRQERLVTWN